MKRNILTLLLCGITLPVFSQTVNDPAAKWTKTETNFNALFVSHRHVVFLERGNKMIVEMFGLDGYDVLEDVGEILSDFQKQTVRFQDSLQVSPSSSLRIDCAYSSPDYKMFRVIKHPATGEMLVNKKGALAPLKIEQDTVRILIQKKVTKTLKSGKPWNTYNPVQLTLVLNNYTDVEHLIAQRQTIQGYVDTMRAAIRPKANKSPYTYRSTILYRPYDTVAERRFKKYDRLIDPDAYVEPDKNHDRLVLNANIGVGLVRNALAPVADLGVEFRNPWVQGEKNYRLFGIYTSSYVVFDRMAAQSFTSYANLFLNGELGSSYEGDLLTVKFQRVTLGGGYLLNPDGKYFKNTTAKLFMNFTLKSGITISPEIIATDNFRQVFPGVTIKIF